MVGRLDSLQTAPNLHDRMWELDGFGDYMKHSFHFQFIVLRRGITFTQMARNLEMHILYDSQNVQEKKKSHFKDFILFTVFFSCSALLSNTFLMGYSFVQLKWGRSLLLLIFKPHGHSFMICFHVPEAFQNSHAVYYL